MNTPSSFQRPRDISAQGAPERRHPALWFVGWPLWLLWGLILLAGRYDWSEPNAPSWRGYLCSAFFLSLLMPLLSSALTRFERRWQTKTVVLAVTATLLTLPYRWLGLDGAYYYLNTRSWFDWKTSPYAPYILWLPEAIWDAPQIPGELVFFRVGHGSRGRVALLCTQPQSIGRPLSRPAVILKTAMLLLIVAETWMHVSMRSPYTYVPHFERSAKANYWYHSYLFSDGRGAVNADYFVFRALEDVFLGTKEPPNGMLIRRPFPYICRRKPAISSMTITSYWS